MVQIPEELQDVLSVDPEMLSGAVCFKGRRVLVQSLLDTLYRDGSIDDFLEGWPDIPRDWAMAVVRWEQLQARRTFGIPSPV